MTNTHTPTFPVETKNLDPEDWYIELRRQGEVQGEKLELFLQEVFSDRIMVGSDPQKDVSEAPKDGEIIAHEWGWCPHNYRLYFSFDKKTFQPKINHGQGMVETMVGYGWVLKNHGKEAVIKNYHGCTITIRKTQAEVINLCHDKKLWIILAATQEEATDFKEFIKRIYNYEARRALVHCIKEFGGESDLQILRVDVRDNEVRDDIIDKFPESMRIDTEHFKKWYAKKTEIKGINKTIRYMHNRIIEPLFPELNRVNVQIGDHLRKIEGLISPKAFFLAPEKNLKTADDFYFLAKKHPAEFNELSEDDKLAIWNHIFEASNGCRCTFIPEKNREG